MRLFIAVDLPPAVREHLLRVQERLRGAVEGRVAWTKPEQFHITLRFLGEQDKATLRAIEQQLPNALQVPPLTLRANWTGFMPRRELQRVVVVGYFSGSRYHYVCGRIEDVCVAAGLTKETRTPLFHSTVGRLRPPRRIGDGGLQGFRDLFPGPEFVADTVSLFESVLRPEGAEHRKLGEFAVGAR